MKIEKEKISNINNNQVFKITFTNENNYIVSFYNFGGYINNIFIPYKNNLDKHEDVLLGYKNFEDYIKDRSYLNCIVGRVCGRIAEAQFNLNNKTYKLFSNDGKHHLHGGKEGFNKKIWNIQNLEENKNLLKCDLTYRSLHLEEGYPGNLNCKASYILTNNNEFIIEFNVESDQDTLINLTNHNYWNFHGHDLYYQKILNHYIKINAQNYCETNSYLIPTGKMLDVKKTKYNFSQYKKIDNSTLENRGIDTCYSINNYDGSVREIALVYSDYTKMGLKLFSNQPGIHFYTGNMMEKRYNGKKDKSYGYQHALCLEPQLFPDAINHTNFESPILCKEDKYQSLIVMKLKNDFDE